MYSFVDTKLSWPFHRFTPCTIVLIALNRFWSNFLSNRFSACCWRWWCWWRRPSPWPRKAVREALKTVATTADSTALTDWATADWATADSATDPSDSATADSATADSDTDSTVKCLTLNVACDTVKADIVKFYSINGWKYISTALQTLSPSTDWQVSSEMLPTLRTRILRLIGIVLLVPSPRQWKSHIYAKEETRIYLSEHQEFWVVFISMNVCSDCAGPDTDNNSIGFISYWDLFSTTILVWVEIAHLMGFNSTFIHFQVMYLFKNNSS